MRELAGLLIPGWRHHPASGPVHIWLAVPKLSVGFSQVGNRNLPFRFRPKAALQTKTLPTYNDNWAGSDLGLTIERLASAYPAEAPNDGAR